MRRLADILKLTSMNIATIYLRIDDIVLDFLKFQAQYPFSPRTKAGIRLQYFTESLTTLDFASSFVVTTYHPTLNEQYD